MNNMSPQISFFFKRPAAVRRRGLNASRRSASARGPGRWPRLRASVLALVVGAAPSGAFADAVTDWNAIMQTMVMPSNAFFQARSAAIVQLAVFEAVNAITHDYEPYLDVVTARHRASPEAAAVAAAHRALVALYPNSTDSLNGARAASLEAIPDGASKDDGIAVGEAAAAAMLALRADDGSGAVVPYTPGTAPGDWQPTPPAHAPALLPGWGAVTTFGIVKGSQFRVPPPPALHTRKYARDYNEVKEIGHASSSERPQDRADVARFYAAVLPVELFNSAARQVSAAQGMTLSENARLFALLAMAVCDGLISSMEAKYHYECWRPVTAIRSGAMDGNRRTDSDAAWLPLINTPPFPSYPSNHATASGAARAVLERIFGEDGFSVTLSSVAVPGVVFNYTAWEQITDDIDDARIFGGIHFRFEQEAGARQGRRVGLDIFRHELRETCRPRK